MEKKEVMVMNLNQTVEEIQGAPRATRISLTDASRGYKDIPVVSDTEVLEKATRRSFTAEYKRRIIREADVCKEQRQIGALLRREGLKKAELIIETQKKIAEIFQLSLGGNQEENS